MSKLWKDDYNGLERLFKAEIEGRLPVQSKAQCYERLSQLGYARHDAVTLPGRFPVRVTGWFLTEAGRIAWCEHASQLDPPERATDS